MPGPSMCAVPTSFLASKYGGSVQAELHARELNRDRFVDTTRERYSYSNTLKREYCLFRMKWKPQDGRLGSDGTCKSFRCAQLSFFKSRIANFKPPTGFNRTLRVWWNEREKYLTEQEISTYGDHVKFAWQ